MNRIFYILVISFFGCQNPNSTRIEASNSIGISDVKYVSIDLKNTQIVKIDKDNNRFFLTIEKMLLSDAIALWEIICDVESLYTIDSSYNISFFTEKKWANYKDEIFPVYNDFFRRKDYSDWLNEFYLAEFSFDDRILRTYPVSFLKKGMKIPLENC